MVNHSFSMPDEGNVNPSDAGNIAHVGDTIQVQMPIAQTSEITYPHISQIGEPTIINIT